MRRVLSLITPVIRQPLLIIPVKLREVHLLLGLHLSSVQRHRHCLSNLSISSSIRELPLTIMSQRLPPPRRRRQMQAFH
jgi:hypothetical protein